MKHRQLVTLQNESKTCGQGEGFLCISFSGGTELRNEAQSCKHFTFQVSVQVLLKGDVGKCQGTAQTKLRPRLQPCLPGDQPIKDPPECSLQADEYCFNYTAHRGCNMQTAVKGLSEPRRNLAHPQSFGSPFNRL